MAEQKKLPHAGLSEVGQIAVTVEDVERATAFYRDVLGVPFLFDAPGLAFFDLGGSHAAPRTPLESPCTFRRTRVAT